ncbi:hypothetical protein [uncultured Brevundimonas sp.]|uniref:hypothetical protein n=1 Tax=uncultured Brevundimonas sp. TaxID=213418 RepID=UPI0026111EE5|nr:hypothetical protein [uncultured Brevundimonas sp.]
MIPAVSGNAQALLANESAVREGIRNGQCHIISLAPVREALGERWSKNEVLVEDFVLRTFRRGADSDDLIIKLNAVDYMVIQPSRSAMSALSRVTLLTRMTLNHFLGQARTEYIRVSFIEEATPGLITARRASTEQMLRATRDAAREQDPTNIVSLAQALQESPPWEPFGTKAKPRKVVIYKRPDSSELEATYYCEPIWNAAREAVGIFQFKTETFRVSAKRAHRSTRMI